MPDPSQLPASAIPVDGVGSFIPPKEFGHHWLCFDHENDLGKTVSEIQLTGEIHHNALRKIISGKCVMECCTVEIRVLFEQSAMNIQEAVVEWIHEQSRLVTNELYGLMLTFAETHVSLDDPLKGEGDFFILALAPTTPGCGEIFLIDDAPKDAGRRINVSAYNAYDHLLVSDGEDAADFSAHATLLGLLKDSPAAIRRLASFMTKEGKEDHIINDYSIDLGYKENDRSHDFVELVSATAGVAFSEVRLFIAPDFLEQRSKFATDGGSGTSYRIEEYRFRIRAVPKELIEAMWYKHIATSILGPRLGDHDSGLHLIAESDLWDKAPATVDDEDPLPSWISVLKNSKKVDRVVDASRPGQAAVKRLRYIENGDDEDDLWSIEEVLGYSPPVVAHSGEGKAPAHLSVGILLSKQVAGDETRVVRIPGLVRHL